MRLAYDSCEKPRLVDERDALSGSVSARRTGLRIGRVPEGLDERTWGGESNIWSLL